MDEHTFDVLEFKKILEMISEHAVTSPGSSGVFRIQPLLSIDEIKKKIDTITEIRNILSGGSDLGIEHFEDLTSLFKKIRPMDSVLETQELRSFLPLFHSALNLSIWRHTQHKPLLREMVSGLITHSELRDAIEQAIEIDGSIRDEASSELYEIREKIRKYEGKIKVILEDILKRKDLEPHIQDYFITQRNNRWVIPVKRDSKGSVPGIVHDISNTGETVFIEPYAIQQLSNELESLRAEERLEQIRILRSLTGLLRAHLMEIEQDYRIIVMVDSLQAIAKFSERLKMTAPEINEQRFMRISRGRHPLLWKTLKSQNREGDLVPLDFEVKRDCSCVIITGSNAGGKTVTLKTIGIITLMALSGMHVPASSGTSIPFFEKVLADIGDEQSIEESLSTFSAHIRRISHILNLSDAQTLVIIDELGSGTDPEQGGALSCAVLKKLKHRGALTVVSTHLGMIKSFAHSEEGMINCAMEMKEIDEGGVKRFRPTYRLIMGVPGLSHAFDIAESLGLDHGVIEEARSMLRSEDTGIEDLIRDLRRKTDLLDEEIKRAEALRREAEEMRRQLERKLSEIERKKKEVLSGALKDAEEILRKTKVEAYQLMESLKKAELKKKRKIIRDIEARMQEVGRQKEALISEKEFKGEIKVGDRVVITPLGKTGVIRSINDKMGRCRVYIDGMEIETEIRTLRPVMDIKEEFREKGIVEDDHLVNEDISDELKIIGERVDPALSKLERFLNDASLSGLKKVRIIHGIGTGRLARAVREYVENHPLVHSWRKGEEGEGGEGVTVVYFE